MDIALAVGVLAVALAVAFVLRVRGRRRGVIAPAMGQQGAPAERARLAIAYLKAEIPQDDPASAMQLSDDDAPVGERFADGLLRMYLVDEGEMFSYVQGRDLRAAGIDADELHRIGLENLRKRAAGVEVRRVDPEVTALFLDGNFEASLLLLDDLWEQGLREHHGGDPVVVIPARDVLCFCSRSSADGVTALRDVVGRVWPVGDHLLSDKLFCREGRLWVVHRP